LEQEWPKARGARRKKLKADSQSERKLRIGETEKGRRGEITKRSKKEGDRS
jgi:hypothetical protein